MSFKTYDKEVWFFLRAIWESLPKISFSDLCELVKEVTNKPVPSPDSVRKKCKSEKWVKKVRKYCQKSDASLDTIKCRLFDEILKEYEKIQADTEDLKEVSKGSLVVQGGIPNFAFSALQDVAYNNRKIIDVIRTHRMCTGKLSQLLMEAMDWMYEAKEIALLDSQTEEEAARAQRRFNLVEAFVEKLEVLSRTSKNLVAQDFLLFGMGIDDTRDSDTSNRMAALKDDKLYDQAKASLNNQFNLMMEKARYIQSGDFETEVLSEQQERERLEQQADMAEMSGDDDDDDEPY